MLHLSNNIKIIRKLSGLTQDEFRKKFTGTSLAMQKSYELGKARPDVLYMQELADISGIPVDQIMKGRITKLGVDKVENVAEEEAVGFIPPARAGRYFLEESVKNLTEDRIKSTEIMEKLVDDKIKSTAIIEELTAMLKQQLNLGKPLSGSQQPAQGVVDTVAAEEELRRTGRTGSFERPKKH